MTRPVGLLSLLSAFALVAACSSSGGSSAPDEGQVSTSDLPTAPAFSAAELADPPTDSWPTNGGDVANRRYSPLDEIDTESVGDLGGVWRTNLGSGTGSRYSAEGTPLFYEGVLYVTTGENDVFALDVETGETLWTYQGNLESEISTICCAWANRGVAMGEGRLYMGRLDGDLVAIDQQTGEELWTADTGDWRDGMTITAAPLYADGVVYTGVSGGEYGVRGRLYALDAETGEELWRRYTVPGPGEPGHETWPQDNDAWQFGGSVIWQTPTIDPELDLIYFSTSNPGPLFNGSEREGENLYSNSILALDRATGEYRWHYQQIHHDLWDYDAANPVVLFDTEIDGEARRGIAEANKNGWVYLIDRETGEPLLPIPETPVPQDEEQHTWPTQPIPEGDAFVPQMVTQEEFERMDAARQGALGNWQYVNEGRVYTPPDQPGPIAKPATLGGANWPPSSFNPDTDLLYVCASDTVSIFGTEEVDYDPSEVAGGRQFLGSAFATPSGAQLTGTFTAMDVRTNTIAWQDVWDTNGDNCYSGSLTTGGDLVFVGRNDGRLVAYDAEDGTELWSYRTGAGANAPAVTFEWEGTQYLALLSGGNALVDSPRGDIVTLFALGGSLPEAEPAGQAQAEGKERAGG